MSKKPTTLPRNCKKKGTPKIKETNPLFTSRQAADSLMVQCIIRDSRRRVTFSFVAHFGVTFAAPGTILCGVGIPFRAPAAHKIRATLALHNTLLLHILFYSGNPQSGIGRGRSGAVLGAIYAADPNIWEDALWSQGRTAGGRDL